MAIRDTGHLSEETIIDAIIDEAGLGADVRRHLLQCPACRAEKEALEGKLTRFGQLAQERMPEPRRRPRLSVERSREAGRTWRFRPTFGMGLAMASLIILVLSPFVVRHGKQPSLDKVYLEMLQDEKFMAEIENLEENPLPKFYVEISDPTDQDGKQELMDNRTGAQDGRLS